MTVEHRAGPFIDSVTAGIVANILYTAMLTVIVILCAFYLVERKRKKLFALFGIPKDEPRLRIYVSRLDVVTGGSQGTDGRLPVGFVGPALMRLEYNAALAIRDATCVELFERVPRFVRALLKSRSPWLRDVAVTLDVNPDADEIEAAVFGTEDGVILLGSDVYSHAARRIFADERSFFFFCKDVTGSPVRPFNAAKHRCEPTFAVRRPGHVEVIHGRPGREVAVVQRVSLAPGGKQLLMCAGISSAATAVAADHVARRWDSLVERFGDDDFGICFVLPGQRPDRLPLVAPEELTQHAQRRRQGA